MRITGVKGQAAAKLRNGENFYGVVDILGSPYITGYGRSYMLELNWRFGAH